MRAIGWIGTLLAATSMLGCFAVNKVERDVDRTPTVNTGAGATILMPGQSPPSVYQIPTPSGAGVGPGTGSGAGPESAGPARGGGNVTMIGGATVDEERHQKVDETPSWWKYAALPFAVIAAPFKYVADKLDSEPEPGPEVPDRAQVEQKPPASAPPPVDYETARMRQLENELDQRSAAPPAPAPRPSAGGSFADELAALRQVAAAPPQPTPTPAPTPAHTPAPAPRPEAPDELAAASGHVDRDGDGRTDQWIFREGGEVVRELLDEDFDGRPDRTLLYDLSTHQVKAIEEDANHDGRIDTWTSVHDGVIVRRRADDNADGQVDTWSYFKRGELSRLERDASGDGFRDRISHYRDGRLSREEEDDDADGLADVVKHYDAQERIERVEEDTNGDGRIDVISHYDAGRLKRREVLDADLLTPAPSMGVDMGGD